MLPPEAASSWIVFLVMWAMNPTMEKMTKPANMLVKEFIQHTMMASLQDGKDFSAIQVSGDLIEICINLQGFWKGRVLPVNIIIEVIIAAQSNQRSQTQAI